MSRENLRFSGINRNNNLSDNKPGDCEELVNIQNEDGALKIVKGKKAVSVNIPYRDIIIHDVADVRNYIGKDSTGWVWFEPQTGDIIHRLYDLETDIDNTYISTLNNMVVISDKNIVANTVYLFNNGKYELFIDNNLSDLSISINHSPQIVEDVKTDEFSLNNPDENGNVTDEKNIQNIQIIKSAIIQFFNTHKSYVFGYYLIGVNFTLWDGTETNFNNLTPFFPANIVRNDYLVYDFPLQYVAYTGRYYISFSNLAQTHSYTISISSSDIEKYKSVVQKINVYISNPILPFEFNTDNISLDYSSSFLYIPNAYYKPIYLPKAKLENQLLYKYKSYDLQTLKQNITEEIKFGLETLPINKTLDVDAGRIHRAGRMNLYNNRLHFYDSIAKVNLNNAYHIKNYKTTDVEYTCDAIIYLRNTNGEDLLLKYYNLTLYSTSAIEPYYTILDHMLIVQDSRAYKVVFTRPGHYCEILLESSPTYNYSYAYFPVLSFIEGDQYDDVTTIDTYSEPGAINVTAQNNPIVFPVEHSYLLGGNIVDIGYATEPLSQTQIGQYPLYVFTDNGIYAMEQGSGAVLYANQLLINTDKCYNSVEQTRNGVVYIANGSIYILSGRNTLNISLPVSGPIDTDIRRAAAYAQCCLNDNLYNVSEYISQVDFRDYISSAKLMYIPYKDELIVSNPKYKYSYVFSLIYKTWHKISESMAPVGDNIIQKAIFAQATQAIAATGEILITNAVVKPAHTFKAAQRAIYSGPDFRSGKRERYSLLIDDEQVSSIYLRYPASLALIIALLCKDISYLDCMYDGSSHFIYSNIAFSAGATVELIQSDTGYSIFAVSLDQWQNVASIPAKAIGDTITVNTSEGGPVNTRAIMDGDSVVSMAAMLSDSINSAPANLGISSEPGLNKLALTAVTAGIAGNGILLDIDAGNYVSLHFEKMSGGKDAELAQDNNSMLIDYTQQVDSAAQVIHIQTRPLSFTQAYSIIRRLILYCKATLSAENNLSVYLFASNDLSSWQCVAASQKSNVTLDHIRLQRSARAYKHYIVIIGGIVNTNTELSFLIMEIEERFSNKIR